MKAALSLLKKDIGDNKAAFAVIGAYFLITRYLFSSSCPMVQMTGLPCPACGLTRAGIALLKGNFKAALEINLMIFPIVILFFVFLFNRYVRKHSSRFLLKYVIGMIVLLIAYYIYRMLRYFPGEPPISYYRNNLLQNLMQYLK